MDPIRISTLLPAVGAAPGLPGDATGAAIDAVRAFAETLAHSEAQGVAAVTGGADPHDLMTAIAESKLAVDTVVALRDRVVESYQEILRMPV